MKLGMNSGRSGGLELGHKITPEFSLAKGEKVVIRIDDGGLSSLALPGCKRAVMNMICSGEQGITKEDLFKIVSRLSNLDPDFGTQGHGFRKALEVATTYFTQDQITASEVVLEAYERLRKNKNPAMVRSFSEQVCVSPRETLKTAVSILNEEYARSIEIVGEIVGSNREHWDVVDTKVTRSIAGNWNRHNAMRKVKDTDQVGTIKNIESGVRIGDRVRSNDEKEGVVLKASHKHGGLNRGTARILVRFDGEKAETHVTPWSLKSVA